MEIRPVAGALGAEILAVDVRTLDDADFAAIRRAYDDHGVIFFRDQQLEPDDHVAFAERWGQINVNRFFTPVPGHPMIAEVRKEPSQTANIGGNWHTDHSYDEVPAMGSILYALETPPVGGDTMFASMSAAYDALSDGLKATIDGLHAHHSSRHAFGAAARDRASQDRASQDRASQDRGPNPGAQRFLNPDQATQDAVHPVVLTHPRTGRRGIYVNGDFTTHFVGWTKAESAPLLETLYAHCRRPEFTCRFDWEPGSIAFWDNLATWHCAVNDYQGQRRLMHRITIEGTPLDSTG